MSPASPRRSFTPTIRRVPGNFEVARFLAAMAPRLVGRAATSSAGRSGCAVVIGAAQPTDQSSVVASIARAADRGFVAVLSRHRYRCESPHHRPTPRRHDERACLPRGGFALSGGTRASLRAAAAPRGWGSRAHRRSICTCTFSSDAGSWRTRGRSQRSTADSDSKPASSRFRRRVGVESSSSVEPTQATSVDGLRAESCCSLLTLARILAPRPCSKCHSTGQLL